FDDGDALAAPYRYFSLPCPDVAADGNWDGVSDILYEDPDPAAVIPFAVAPCGARTLAVAGVNNTGYSPNMRGARTGRFPWRTFNGQIGGEFAYIHGAGNSDILDEFGNRLWYSAARNMTREDRALNLHWQMRQEEGWLHLTNLSEISRGISDFCIGISIPDGCDAVDIPLYTEAFSRAFGRVAAVAISPGLRGGFNFGSRLPESANVSITAALVSNVHRAYLEDTTAGLLDGSYNLNPSAPFFDVTVSPLIFYETTPDENSTDAISYFTIDDLAAEGDRLFSDEGGAIADLLAGRDGHLGVRQLMRAHFTRYGYLPAPAAFGRRTAETPQRRSGVPPTPVAVGTAGDVVNLQAGVVAPTNAVAVLNVTVTAVLPLRNIGRVYLQPGTRLAAEDFNTYGDGLPPYNLALYGLDTAFNQEPMDETLRTALVGVDVYPHENLFGFRQQTDSSRVAADSPVVRGAENPLAPLDSRVYMSRPPPLRDVAFISPQVAMANVALAEPALAYMLPAAPSAGLSGIVALADGSRTTAAEAPSYGIQVKLPPGTRFSLHDNNLTAEENLVSLFLPSRIEVSGAIFDRPSRRWVLQEQLSQPALVADGSDRLIIITAVLSGLAADSANIGFLPAADGEARYLDTDDSVSLGVFTDPAGVVSFSTLPGGDVSLAAAGGVNLPYNQAVSHLPTDLPLFTNGRLVITPFPPAGRPAAVRDAAGIFSEDAAVSLAVPSALFINFDGYSAAANTLFTLPAGAQIYYPPDAEINLGEDFAFPAGTRALLPPGTIMTAEVLPDSNLPGGFLVQNTAAETRAVTLAHGAMMELSGRAFDPAAGTPPGTGAPGAARIGARIVLEDGFGIGSAQEMFDVELQTPYRVLDAGGGSPENFDGGILQPLTGRTAEDSIAPIAVTGRIRLHTWTRARFLTRSRNLPLRGAPNYENAVIVHPAAGGSPVATTTLSMALIDNVPLPGGRETTVTVRARIGAENSTGMFTVPLRINEQTDFLIPPGGYDVTSLFSIVAVNSDLGTRNLATVFTFPDGTAIYDPNIPSLADITVGAVNGLAVLEGALTVETATPVSLGGIVVHQLVLLPDSDAPLQNGDVIPAGSVVDAVQGFAWPPGAVYTLPGAASDLSATSKRQMYLYFSSGVTLTNRAAIIPAGVFTGPLPGTTIIVDYSDPNFSLSDVSAGDIRALSAVMEEAPEEFPLHYAVGTDGWGGATPTGAYAENAATAVLQNDFLALPPGTFIVLPSGGTLDFLSPYTHDDSVTPEDADFVFLPENAVAVPPLGAPVTVGMLDAGGATVDLVLGAGDDNQSSPHIRLGGEGGRGLAIVADSSYMETSPIVFYESDAYLFDSEGPAGEIDDVVSRIPGGARGDIFGNITRRDGLNFALDLLPSDTAEFLRNFPLIYAVAEDCRAGYGDDGDCADDEGAGLEFAVEDGEVVVLEEEMIAGGTIFISVHSALGNSSLAIISRTRTEFYDDPQAAGTSSTVGGIFVDGMDGSAEFFDGGASSSTTSDDVLEISMPALAAEDAEIRVYMNVTAAVADIVADPDSVLADAHYAVVPALTLFAGGWTDGGEVSDAAAAFVLDASVDAATGISNMQIGFGARVGGDLTDQFPFGADSFVEQSFTAGGGGTPVRIPLDRYAVANTTDQFAMNVNSASRYANLDTAGQIVFDTDVGDRIAISGGGSQLQLMAQNSALATGNEPFNLDLSQDLAMEQGYLWQGYINPRGADISLAFSTDAALTTGGVLSDEVYVRVHPADEQLSFWGSGLERAEGMDNRSIGRLPPVEMTTVYTFDFRNMSFPERDSPPARVEAGPFDLFPYYFSSTVSGADIPGRFIYNRLWRYGWRSPLVGRTNADPGADMFFRVWNANTGELVEEEVAGDWVPMSRQSNDHSVAKNEGYVVWAAANAAPFAVPDQAYLSNSQEVWAHRRMAAVVRRTGRPLGSNNAAVPVGIEEDSIVRLTITNNVAVTAVFNMPAFQLRGRALRPSPAWEYNMKEANVWPFNPGSLVPSGTAPFPFVPVADLPDCPLNPVLPAAFYVRAPATLLGRFPDTNRHGALDCGNLGPGFSGRLRRNSVLTGNYFIAPPAVAEVDVELTFPADAPRGVPNPITATIAIPNIQQPETRMTLPQDPADTPPDAEVRAAEGNNPQLYNPGTGDAAAGGNPENPRDYTVPGARIHNTIVVNPGAASAASAGTWSESLGGATRTIPLHSDLVFYMDRAYTPDHLLPISIVNATGTVHHTGIPAQRLSLGANFRISGPGALVPHFGGRRADSTADVYASRSRLFYGMFANDADNVPDGVTDDPNYQLHGVYSEGGYECRTGDGLNTGAGGTCPQMQDPENAKFWIPIISGVMAFEGVNIQLTGPAAALQNNLDIALVVPQPQMEVVDDTSTTRTIYAGSIIDPRRGVVIPSQRILDPSRLVVLGDSAAAVDVSPVSAPIPVRRIREGARMHSWDMYMPPVRSDDGAYIIEPLRFDDQRLVNFTNFRVNDFSGLNEGGRGDTPAANNFVAGVSDGFREVRNCRISRTQCRFPGYVGSAVLGGIATSINENPASGVGGFTRSFTPASDITIRYDGTLTRGFLANERMVNILTTYYGGGEIWSSTVNLFTTYFPRRGYGIDRSYGERTTTQKFGTWTYATPAGSGVGGAVIGSDLGDDDQYNPPVGTSAAQLGNPLSWHWLHRDPEGSFVPMGMARQFAFGQQDNVSDAVNFRDPNLNGSRNVGYVFQSTDLAVAFPIPSPGVLDVRTGSALATTRTFSQPSFRCGFDSPNVYPASFPHYPRPSDVFHSNVPCVGLRDNREESQVDINEDTGTGGGARGPSAYYRVGVIGGSSATGPNSVTVNALGQEIEQDEDEFLALRLPHLINIPAQSTMQMRAFGAPAYPIADDRFFQFPDGSVANILQVDAASWESVHPYVSRYLPGAEFSNDGGVYPPSALPAGADPADFADDTRRLLGDAETMRVRENNDGHRRVDVGGRRVVHYARTETTPGDYTYSSTHAYTNVWIRLPAGGYLVSDVDGSVINLPANTIVNPILGTYLHDPDPARSLVPPVRANYQAYADTDAAAHPITVARPALVLPPGTTVRVGENGGTITNVKAAAIFSIRPIDNVSCPYGDVSNSLATGLALEKPISQSREGVSENEFPADGSEGVFFTIGHPCAWADDSENTDGDRFFVYRSRRRYFDENRARVLSNDRTYLFGGRLQLS
ncbi:MAG: hypothetical protein ACR2QC_02305, partial [Gammaproteobacteria bacterium]